MIKRMLVLFLAALMVFCTSVSVAQTAARSDYTGNWTLEAVILDGKKHSGESVGMQVIINIHGDDTVTFCVDQRFSVSRLTYGDDGASFNAPKVPVALTLLPDGKLVAQSMLGDTTVQFIMKRAPKSDLVAELASLTGRWVCVGATTGGVTLSDQQLPDMFLSVYADGYAMLALSGETVGTRFLYEDGALVMTDDSAARYPVALDAQGRLNIELASVGLLLTMEREMSDREAFNAWIPDVIGEPADCLQGVWVFTAMIRNGTRYPADAVRDSMTLTVQEGVDVLCYGDSILEREAVVGTDYVDIGGICFVLNDEGQLTYTVQEGSAVTTIFLERQGD